MNGNARPAGKPLVPAAALITTIAKPDRHWPAANKNARQPMALQTKSVLAPPLRGSAANVSWFSFGTDLALTVREGNR